MPRQHLIQVYCDDDAVLLQRMPYSVDIICIERSIGGNVEQAVGFELLGRLNGLRVDCGEGIRDVLDGMTASLVAWKVSGLSHVEGGGGLCS